MGKAQSPQRLARNSEPAVEWICAPCRRAGATMALIASDEFLEKKVTWGMGKERVPSVPDGMFVLTKGAPPGFRRLT